MQNTNFSDKRDLRPSKSVDLNHHSVTIVDMEDDYEQHEVVEMLAVDPPLSTELIDGVDQDDDNKDNMDNIPINVNRVLQEPSERGCVVGSVPSAGPKTQSRNQVSKSANPSSHGDRDKRAKNTNHKRGTDQDNKVSRAILCSSCRSPDHKIRDCPKAPVCDKCSWRGHTSKSCRATDSIAAKRKQKQIESSTRQKKQAVSNHLKSLEGLSAEDAAAKLVVQNQPNTCPPKVDFDEDAEISIPELPVKAQEESPLDLPDVLEFYWPREQVVTTLTLNLCKVFGIIFLFSTWLITFIEAPLYVTQFVLCFNLMCILYLIWTMKYKRKVALKLTARRLAVQDEDDRRTDTEKLLDLKHKKSLPYQATFEWWKYRESEFPDEGTSLNPFFISNPDHFNLFAAVPRPPRPMNFSAEAFCQMTAPNVFDVKSSVEEMTERINNHVRAAGSVISNRYASMQHDHLITAAGYVASFASADWLWRRKNTLSLN